MFSGISNADWLVKSKGTQAPFTLNEDGTVVKNNRGDPKASFDQSENCRHGKSKNCTPQNTLEGALVLAQGGSNHEDYFVSFRRENYVYVIQHDLKEYGEPISAFKNGIELSISTLTLDIYYDVELPSDLKRVITYSNDGVLLGLAG